MDEAGITVPVPLLRTRLEAAWHAGLHTLHRVCLHVGACVNEECVQCGRCEVGRTRVSRLVVACPPRRARAVACGCDRTSCVDQGVSQSVERERASTTWSTMRTVFPLIHTSGFTLQNRRTVPAARASHIRSAIGQRRGRQPTRDSAPSRRVFRAACLFGRHSAPARPDPPRPCTVLSLCLTPLSSLPEAAPSRALSACPCGQLVHPRVVTCAPPTLRSPPFHNARPLPAPHGSRMCEPPCRIRAREHMARTSTPPVHTHAPVTPRNSRTRHHPHLLASEL